MEKSFQILTSGTGLCFSCKDARKSSLKAGSEEFGHANNQGAGSVFGTIRADTPPHDSLESIARWAKGYGYKSIQIPSWDRRLFDLDKAADSEIYCDEIKGRLADIGIVTSEFSSHFQGQMVSVHPAYDAMFDGQAPSHVRGNPEKRRLWAADQVTKAAIVSQRFGLTEHVTFCGSLAWALLLPLSAASRRFNRRVLCRTGSPLGADSRCIRCGRRGSLLRNPSHGGHVRRRHFRDVPRSGG